MSLISTVTTLTYGILLLSIGLSVWRLLRGPSLADRVVAIDFLALAAIGFIGVSSLENHQYAYLDVAIATALVAFLATVAFARYVMQRAAVAAASPPESRSTGGAEGDGDGNAPSGTQMMTSRTSPVANPAGQDQ